MKHVIKGESPEIFEEWKAKANDDWQPTYQQLADPEKRALHSALVHEQGWVCCYCGQEIALENSHIEHFRPQNLNRELALSFGNMYASCLRQRDPGMPLHCGHAKDNEFDESLFIDPQDPTCEERFAYSSLGQVAPAHEEDKRAGYMINLLQLNSPILEAKRKEAINLSLGPDFLETLNNTDLRKFRDACRTPNEHGKLLDFGHAIARYADQYLPDSAEDVAVQQRDD